MKVIKNSMFPLSKNYCSNKKYSINSIATVYNTSSSEDKEGKHWISTFSQKVDNNNIYVYYFDSLGHPIPHQIKSFFDKLKIFFKKHNTLIYIFDNSSVKHQYSNSECGVYAITFIKKLLDNSTNLRETYNLYFKNPQNIYSDTKISKERKVYFKQNQNKLFNSDILNL